MDFDLTEEQRLWQKSVRAFAEAELRPRAHEVDETGEFNWPAVRKMGPLGLLGLNIPEAYGGAGVDAVSAALAIEELAWGCGSTALAISAHNGLGCAPVALFGTDAQKERWLRPAAVGKGKLASLALTEPGAGSDLQGIATRAWKDGDEWVIRGEKMWLTNASVADFIVTLVRTSSEPGTRALSQLIVPTDAIGLRIAPAEKKMGLKGSPAHAISYDDVRVPAENLLGEEGRGLHQTLITLDGGRLGIGAMALGLARAAHEYSITYAKGRKTFGEPISSRQAIQWMLAEAETEINAARLMVHRAAWLKQQGRPFTMEAAQGKMFASEVAERVCRNAIQIHGGYGYSREYPVERLYRDVRLLTIGEGTSEILRTVIARRVLADGA
jgi:alkylation response protein AidB-like acyl-CoA dehydrogenase